jgi:hypothetical protein
VSWLKLVAKSQRYCEEFQCLTEADRRTEMDHTQDRKKYWLVRKKTVYIVLGLMLVINVPLFIWLFGEMHASAEAFDAFGQRLIAKDYDGAYNTASDEFRSAVSKQEFVEQQTTLSAKLGSLKTVKRGGSETNFDSKGGFTTVDATFVFENAERQFSIKLKKVGNSWRLYGYREE